ncbi:MAG TPA: TIGR01906 family membrane protein [Longilinea sp.]|nr:TIGR01906 family membrane protein [Longilinea sp.]
MKTLQKVVSFLVTIAIPLFLLMTAIRVLFQPLFLQIEYRAPGFPEDSFGFSLQDRLMWGGISMEYMFNNQGISFLGDQRLPDGSPLYNDRELGHMADVKVLVQLMIRVWTVLFAALVVILIWAWRGKWLKGLGEAYARGAWLTLGFIGAIFIAIVTGFDALFTAFHRLFFQGDSWLFLYSDSLIRLFPIRLWQDAFIGMGILTVIGAMIFLLIGKWFTRKTR